MNIYCIIDRSGLEGEMHSLTENIISDEMYMGINSVKNKSCLKAYFIID